MRRFALALCVLVACGADDDGGPLTVDDLPGAVVSAYCNAYVRCGLVSDVATCRQLDLDLEFDPEITAAVKNGTVIYNETEARLCLAGFGNSCEEDAIVDDNGHCDLVFEGTVGANGACQINEQCLSHSCQITSCPDACCPGTCYGDAPPVRPGIGESCATASCLDGYCDVTTELCTAFKGTGQACEGNNECSQGYCNGVCTNYPGEGDPCLVGGDTRSCGSIGLYCNPSTMVCTKYALDGDACDSQITFCSPAYDCTGGSCELKPTLGDTCNPQTSDCIDASYCEPTTLKCTAPLPDGAACDDNSRCAGNCDFTTMKCVSDPICI